MAEQTQQSSGNGMLTAVHITTELIVVGGIAFYYHNQVKQLKAEISQLKQKLDEANDVNGKHFNTIYNTLDRFNNALNMIHMEKSNQRQSYYSQPPVQKSKQKTPIKVESVVRNRKQNKPIVQKEQKTNEEHLDEELDEELRQLENEEKEHDNNEKEQGDDVDDDKTEDGDIVIDTDNSDLKKRHI